MMSSHLTTNLQELDEILMHSMKLQSMLRRLKGPLLSPSMASTLDLGYDMTAVIPNIKICERNILCNDFVIVTKFKPLTLKLFEIFMEDPDKKFTRHELAARLYSDFDPGQASPRFQQSTLKNVVKLICRARILAASATNNRTFKWIEWFPEVGQGWCFFRLTNRYLAEWRGSNQQANLRS